MVTTLILQTCMSKTGLREQKIKEIFCRIMHKIIFSLYFYNFLKYTLGISNRDKLKIRGGTSLMDKRKTQVPSQRVSRKKTQLGTHPLFSYIRNIGGKENPRFGIAHFLTRHRTKNFKDISNSFTVPRICFSEQKQIIRKEDMRKPKAFPRSPNHIPITSITLRLNECP